ncbi:unnamed protein product [Sphagnum troendelagicum]|uniref:Protein kinase domain-containing protein n=1 Tax=Sphagnum troendelagicum TaxID=128251 RepID=A0ABP0UEF2_9BRYO
MRSRRSSACSNGSREEAVVSSTCSKPQQSSSSHHKSNLSSGRSIGVGRDFSERVVVAIDATREITKHALEWALTNVVVQSGEIITLLAVLPTGNSSVRRIWGLPVFLPLFGGDCSFHYGRVSMRGSHVSVEEEVHEACSLMLQQVHMLCTSKKVNVRVKVVQAAGREVTAMESRKLGATWVVLDRHLKKEGKFCKDLLQCNIVLVKSEPKILRLNLKGTGPDEPNVAPAFVNDDGSRTPSFSKEDQKDSSTALKVLGFPGSDGNTPSSSPDDIGTPFTPSDHGTFSNSNTSSEQSSSPYATSKPGNRSPEMSVRGAILEAATADFIEHGGSYTVTNFDSDEDKSPEVVRRVSTSLRKSFDGNVICQFENMTRNSDPVQISIPEERCNEITSNQYKYGRGFQGDQEAGGNDLLLRSNQGDLERTLSIRKAVMLSRQKLPGPPPLCSICQHKAPVFGKPPQRYTYAELELATAGFAQANFLAEGGYGSVHRGILPDGQAVAVKQHKLASTQGDKEFCSEVEVLSCAQHRNVVMLNGYCVEGKRRLLVYEFICNSSLDSHLYGKDRVPLEWHSRQKIAVGAARGLRYLHEDCRVGCIVHRDLRPNNILLTHDFEPLVGDFGLARWQPDGDCGVDTRVIGTFGYLAPEYTQSGQITDKADVYSFGVVLLELITGRKAVDLNRPRGEQCLTEWARPLLEEKGSLLVDPRLENRYSDFELHCMLHAAACCIRRDPQQRPRMSQVLRMLEGEIAIDTIGASPPPAYVSRKPSFDGLLEQKPKAESSGTPRIKPLTSLIIPLKSQQSNSATRLCEGPTIVDLSLKTPDFVTSCELGYVKRPSTQPSLPATPSSSKLSFEALRAAYEEKAHHTHILTSAY